MAVDLIPVELDIDDALNTIETLQKRIDDLFKQHGNSEDPRMVKTLQSARKVGNELSDIKNA